MDKIDQAAENSPHASYLTKLREALHSNTASVLVGSGFSRNANPEMPKWDSWAKTLAEKLKRTDKDKLKAQDVPWLAGAYSQHPGVSELQQLLLDPLDDLKVEKSSLHVQLVCLPWADIFTTNYDTFLEQAAEQAKTTDKLARKYKKICDPSQISLSRRNGISRIIKLHGCLSNKNGCIVTEEQYRKYRNSHAPFVNTVRQSLLENHFCLLGYSASDPDFLEWVGWVRDNLENYALNIYWLTPSEITRGEENVYKQRGIKCISLNCFNLPPDDSPTSEKSISSSLNGPDGRNAYAASDNENSYFTIFNNFFRWLHRDPTHTDNSKHINDEKQLSWEYTQLDFKTDFSNDTLSWEKTLEFSELMRQSRESYPGWLLPPMTALQQMWSRHMEASRFVKYLSMQRQTVSDCELLNPLREVCWLMDRAGMPPFNNISVTLNDILNGALPSILKSLTGKTVENAPATEWIASALLLLRWCREERDDKQFNAVVRNLKKLLKKISDPEAEAHIAYQRILHSLERFDRRNALKLLRSWKPAPYLPPIWFIRKAMLLGELGHLQQGYTLLKAQYDALLPLALKGDCSPEVSSSTRLAAEYLRQFSTLVGNNLVFVPSSQHKDYSDIPDTFKNELPPLCKGEPDIVSIINSLYANVTTALHEVRVVPSKLLFETGKMDTSIHFSSGLRPGFREVFQCARAIEHLGRTPYLGHASFNMPTWHNMAQLFFYLQRGITEQSVRILLRAAPTDTFNAGKDIFLQYHLACLDDVSVLNLVEQLCKGLQQIGQKSSTAPFETRHAQFGLELLSRLCVRVSQPEKQQELLNIALNWMQNGPTWNHIRTFDNVSLLLRRLVKSISFTILNRNLSRILSSPVLAGFNNLNDANITFRFSRHIDIADSLPYEMQNIKRSSELHEVAATLWEELKAHEDELEMESAETKSELRKVILSCYYWRLLWMLNHDLVGDVAKEDMAQFVWKNFESQGFPALPHLRIFSILDWPVPKMIDVASRYKEVLLKQSIPPAITMTADGRRSYSSNYSVPLEDYLNIGIERRKRLALTYEDKLRILNNCHESQFQQANTDARFAEYMITPVQSCTWILSYIFGGSLKSFEDDAPWLATWLEELDAYAEKLNANCLRLKVLNLLFNKSDLCISNLSLTLEESMYSKDKSRQLDAGLAVLLWRSEVHSQVPCPDDLFQSALRGFWLLDDQRATNLGKVLLEQLDQYPVLLLDEKEQNILLRALKGKFATFRYAKGEEQTRFPDDVVRSWIRDKEDLEALPERRLVVGQIIASLCKAILQLYSSKVIQQFVQEMRADPLAEMRRIGESIVETSETV